MEGLCVLSCTPGTNRGFSRIRELAKREQTNFQVAGLQYEILIVTNTKYAAMQHRDGLNTQPVAMEQLGGIATQ